MSPQDNDDPQADDDEPAPEYPDTTLAERMDDFQWYKVEVEDDA